MFEALAILIWLGDRFGAAQGLWPAVDSPARLQALAWSTWAYVSYGQPLSQRHLASSDTAPAELRSTEWANYASGALQNMLAVLDKQLAKTGFVVGDRYSLTDLIVSGVVGWSRMTGVSMTDHGNVSKWLGECMARPAIKKEYGM